MAKHWRYVAMSCLICLGMGCSSGGSGGAKAETPEKPSRPVPADSPFAKVKIGMGSDEVFATIGQPTSQKQYQTGKAWIPFHFGGDNFRMSARYKGQGVLTFSSDSAFTSGMSLSEIYYDPDEPGYVKSETK